LIDYQLEKMGLTLSINLKQKKYFVKIPIGQVGADVT
jgi:hypothetical protein